MTTILTKQEKKWLAASRYKRLIDGEPVLVSPMGAERFLYSVLLKKKHRLFSLNKIIYSKLFGLNKKRYNLKSHVINKTILVIPGYANNSFIFAEAGAKSVIVYDKDPVTVAWLKAIKKYYNYSHDSDTKFKAKPKYPTVGDILKALSAWYPPIIKLPKGNILNLFLYFIQPNFLRSRYLNYLVSLIERAVKHDNLDNFELDKDITFFVGDENKLEHNMSSSNHDNNKESEKLINNPIDTVYVPYLLGIENGISEKKYIISFFKTILKVAPNSNIFVTPSRSLKQFKFVGHKYLVADNYESIQKIAEVEKYFVSEDKKWMRTQGLAIFKNI